MDMDTLAGWAAEVGQGAVGQYSAATLAVLVVTDVAVTFGLGVNTKARWYFIHALCNAYISYLCVGPALDFVSDPVEGLANPVPFDASAIAIAVLHAYHLLLFKCSKADWLHHILFVAVGTTVQVFYRAEYGALSAFYHLFISGLPGGIDYFVLGLVELGVVSKRQRVKLALELNMWVRAPALVMSATFALIWYTQSDKAGTFFACFGAFVMIFISYANGIFYARQVALAAGSRYKIE